MRWRLVDDLDGSPATETVAFGIDGRHYEIDLCAEHATQLRAVLDRHAEAGRVAGTSRRTRARPAGTRPRPAARPEPSGAAPPPALTLVRTPPDTVSEPDTLSELLRALLAELSQIGREAARTALAELARRLAREVLAWLDRHEPPTGPHDVDHGKGVADRSS